MTIRHRVFYRAKALRHLEKKLAQDFQETRDRHECQTASLSRRYGKLLKPKRYKKKQALLI